MNKEFIPYELQKELYELGYNDKTFGVIVYQKTGINEFSFVSEDHPTEWMSGILYQQAFRWFREKGIVNSIRSHNDKCHDYYFIHNGKAFQSFHSSTYEQAELECLNHLIRLFNQNK